MHTQINAYLFIHSSMHLADILLLGMFDSQEVSFKSTKDFHSCVFVTLPVPESLVSQASGGLVIGEKLP